MRMGTDLNLSQTPEKTVLSQFRNPKKHTEISHSTKTSFSQDMRIISCIVSFLSALCPWNHPQSSCLFLSTASLSLLLNVSSLACMGPYASISRCFMALLKKPHSLTKHHIIIFKLIQCEYFPDLPSTQYLEACGLVLSITTAKNKILLMESSARNWEMILEHPALPDFFFWEFFPILEFYHRKIDMHYYQPQESCLSFFTSSPEWLKNDNF